MNASQPFDGSAATYDEMFSKRRLGIWLREMVWRHLPFEAGDHVLELGCGTGEDALTLAWHGIHVTATDVSTEMLAVAAAKIRAAEMTQWVALERLDLNDLSRSPLSIGQTFDGVLANFGVVNCVEDRRALAAFLAGNVRRDGAVALVVMGPLCPWEIGWHLLHFQPRRALRRIKKRTLAHVGGGQTLRVWYPTCRRLQNDFLPYFQLTHMVGIGTLLPPSYLAHLVERWPGLFARLASVDRRLGGYFPLTWLNDHYLAIFRRL